MTEPTLNPLYPSLHAVTSYIVATAVSEMLKISYETGEDAKSGIELLTEWICDVFTSYPFEEDAPNVRLQVMRELEFIGFAW